MLTDMLSRAGRLLAICCLCAACNGQKPVVTELLNYDQCQQLEPGAAQISLGELAGVRGSRLLTPPGSSQPARNLETPPHVILVAVYHGTRPTAGYNLELLSAKQNGDHLRLEYTMHSPAPDMAVAQVVTSPCSVVQIDYAPQPAADPVVPGGRVSAWLDEEKIGELEVAAPG